MQLITSVNNSIIKEIKSLKIKKYRDQNKLYFIEGYKFVEEALSSDAEINSIFVCDIIKENKKLEIFNKARQKEYNIKVFTVSDNVLNQLSDTQTPQGILAVVKMRNYSFLDIAGIDNKNNLFIILDDIRIWAQL